MGVGEVSALYGDALERAHPAANLFPMLGETELRELSVDIAENGQHDAVILHEGLILDGRNRWAACRLVCVEPRTEVWESNGASPTAYVISKNLHRRHLTPSQRAAVAAEALPLFEKEADERRRELGRAAAEAQHHPERVQANLPEPIQTRQARDDAAKQFDVSPRYVQEAKRIKEADEVVFELVKAGDMTIQEAKRATAKPKANPDDGEIGTTTRKLVALALGSSEPAASSLKRYGQTGGSVTIPGDVERAAAVIQEHFDDEWIASLVALLSPSRLRTKAAGPRPSLEEKFRAFHQAHPDVLERLRRAALDAASKEQGILSARQLLVEIGGVSNNLTAAYARTLMEIEPSLRGRFETRGRAG